MACQPECQLSPAYRSAFILNVSEALNSLNSTSFVPFCEIMEYLRNNYKIDGDLRSQLQTSLKQAYRMGIIAKKNDSYQLMAPAAVLTSKPVGEEWRKCQNERLQTVFGGTTINFSRCCRVPKRCPVNFNIISRTPSLGTIYRRREKKNKCMVRRKILNGKLSNVFRSKKCQNYAKKNDCKKIRQYSCKAKSTSKCNALKKASEKCMENICYDNCDCPPIKKKASNCKPSVRKKSRSRYKCDPYKKTKRSKSKPRKINVKPCFDCTRDDCDCPPISTTKKKSQQGFECDNEENSHCSSRSVRKKKSKQCFDCTRDDCDCPPISTIKKKSKQCFDCKNNENSSCSSKDVRKRRCFDWENDENCDCPLKKYIKLTRKKCLTDICYNSPALRLKRKICEEAQKHCDC